MTDEEYRAEFKAACERDRRDAEKAWPKSQTAKDLVKRWTELLEQQNQINAMSLSSWPLSRKLPRGKKTKG